MTNRTSKFWTRAVSKHIGVQSKMKNVHISELQSESFLPNVCGCVCVWWGRYYETSWGSHEQVREWPQWGRSMKNSGSQGETSVQAPSFPGALWSISDSGLQVFAKTPLVTRGNCFLRKLLHGEKVCFENVCLAQNWNLYPLTSTPSSHTCHLHLIKNSCILLQ